MDSEVSSRIDNRGRFVADVLAFEGDDGPNDLPMMQGTAIPDGYDYDGCDAKVLARAWVENGQIVARLMLPLTLTFDHRIADGADGARFAADIVRLLEHPDHLLLEL